MATIFRVRHTKHGGLFAVKVLHAELAARPEVVQSFGREAMHAARLGGHPNAVPVFDFGEVEGLHFMIMPFIEGEDLDRLLAARGPLPRGEALRCAAQITGLLCYAESHGITHGDLAPGNLRLDVFGRYRVLDLGLSHRAGTGSSFQALGGTPLYSSPEQVRGEVPDMRSDIYSLGMILVETLTGKPLLEANSLDELKRKHLEADWKLPAAIEADLELAKLLRSMLATDRERRLGSALALSEGLAALDFDRGDLTLVTKPSSRDGEGAQRRRRLSATDAPP